MSKNKSLRAILNLPKDKKELSYSKLAKMKANANKPAPNR